LRVAFDIECNALKSPTQIWCIVLKDLDKGEYHVYRNLTTDEEQRLRFLDMARTVTLWVGHNILDYDLPVLHNLLKLHVQVADCLDTLVLSRLVDYPREGHSIESYGLEFNLPKGEFNDWSKFTDEMVQYCTRDVDICARIYSKHVRLIRDHKWQPAIQLEHHFASVCRDLHDTGFGFDTKRAMALLERVSQEIGKLDEHIRQFPPVFKFIREVTPRATKYGTINRASIPRSLHSSIHTFTVGASFSYGTWEVFNPDSLRQVIDLLWRSGWKPEDKTAGHLEALRKKDLDKLEKFKYYGYKVNETNLATLPAAAPPAAKTLARRILYESRRRTLTEWLGLVEDDQRIHGKFQGIGAWTHRMAHQAPNMANIPNSLDQQGKTKFLGSEMRSLFIAPHGRLLVGVDAAAIQLRVFAHYIDDAEFTKSLIEGKKEDKSDPHSLNQRVLGRVCKTRAAAKRFIFALLLGAGERKLSEILDCSNADCRAALGRLLERYEGFARLKRTVIPADGKRGYFIGLDGREVRIPGETVSERRHLCMSGYLQNGEAVIMKLATIEWMKQLKKELFKDQWCLVNLVHDEWQTECIDNQDVAMTIAKAQSASLKTIGERLQLKCPLEGSYRDDDNNLTIGKNWKVTH